MEIINGQILPVPSQNRHERGDRWDQTQTSSTLANEENRKSFQSQALE